MFVDGGLVRADEIAVSAVRDGHDVDVVEFGAALAPVAVGEDVVSADFAARLDFASGGNGPMEEGVEAGDALAGGGRLDVLEEGGEASDDFALVEAFGDLEENGQREIGLARAGLPQVLGDFVGGVCPTPSAKMPRAGMRR